jgi:DNA-binding Xre family transcriptional regulator
MSVSYEKLRIIMAKYRISGEMLRKETSISTTEAAKINKDVYMTLQSLERITRYLTQVVKRRVKVDDIITFVDD